MTNKTQNDIEIRDAEGIDVSDDVNKSMKIEGVAVRFDTPSCIFTDSDGTQYFETVAAGAFDGVDFINTILRYNHDDSVPVLASCKNGTMSIAVDDDKLSLTATLADTTSARDIYQLVKSGTVGGLSIAFRTAENGDEYTGNTRIIKKIAELIEISIVDHPAYQNTSVAVRSIERARKQREDKRKQLICRTYF